MPTMMDDPRELFLHELGDLLNAENTLVKTLPKLAQEATDTDLQKGFEAHLGETKQHVANLKQIFEIVGEKAKAEKCPATAGQPAAAVEGDRALVRVPLVELALAVRVAGLLEEIRGGRCG